MSKIKFILLLTLAVPFFAMAHGGEHDELIFRMTKEGFEPKEMTVTQGDEVIFINNDDVDRWPASNYHPTHTLYPEFDPKRHIKPGESWKFTFDKVGTWHMHDHLFPHMTATIVVLENVDQKQTLNPSNEQSSTDTSVQPQGFWSRIKAFFSNLFKSKAQKVSAVDPSALAEFKSLNEEAKYAWLEKRAELENPEIAWQYVLDAYNTPQGVVGSPHDMAHLVGQLLFKKYGLDGLSVCTPSFAFGCYHGLMEVAFSKNDSEHYQENLAKAEKGCAGISSTSKPTYWSCIHGMGHGIATFRDYDASKALRDCDLLDSKVSTYCYDGIFMEFSISAPPSFYKESDPLYPCNAIDTKYRSACARSQAQVMRSRFRMSIGEVAKACKASGDKEIIYHCIDALGYFAGQSNLANHMGVIKSCGEIADADSRAQCVAAAAGELVFQDSAGWQKSVGPICDTLTGSYKETCNARVENVKKNYGRK